MPTGQGSNYKIKQLFLAWKWVIGILLWVRVGNYP
jgi:hypothetical protein